MLIAALLSASPAAPAKLVTGLVAPTLTPFHANGTVDLAGVDRQAKFLQATNVSWIFCSGTTGESVDLTVAERKLIAERWMALSKKSGAFRVIVHVGAESIVDTKEMAAHAESLGAHAIAAMPPPSSSRRRSTRSSRRTRRSAAARRRRRSSTTTFPLKRASTS